MLGWLLVRWAVLAVAIGLTAWIMPGVDVDGSAWSLVVVAAIFGLVNALLGTVLRLLTLPLTIITLGLFAIVVNAILVQVTDWISDDLTVDGFLPALGAAILIALISAILNFFVDRRD